MNPVLQLPDAQGFATFLFPLPATPAPPYGLAMQWVFFEPVGGAWSASPALVF